MSRSVLAQSILALLAGASLVGCHDLAGTQALPAGTQDPSYYNNATGALGMRNAAVFAFGNALPGYIVQTAKLTDEMTKLGTTFVDSNQTLVGLNTGLDVRILPELAYGATGSYASDVVYRELQGARTGFLQAIGQLAAYDTSAKDTLVLKPAVGRAVRGELYALYGYDDILLADLFCSGIPLSTVDFQNDFTYRTGSTTAQVYQDAIGKLDTALALSTDSAWIQDLARIGLGRAYLDLGNIAAAVDDVTVVPTDYQYRVTGDWGSSEQYGFLKLWDGTVSDREGGTGLPYISSGDPRTSDTTVTYVANSAGTNRQLDFPKVHVDAINGGIAPTVVASGVEARLIEAEAALRNGDASWLMILNTLRTTGTVAGTYTRRCQNGITDGAGHVLQAGSPCPVGVVDTTWSAGTGIGLIPLWVQADNGPVCPASVAPGTPCTDTVWYKGLRPMTDPGIGLNGAAADSARIALLFRERAFWLYMTGHREGDLRRQLRQYAQYWPDPSQVYPSGDYGGFGNYGSDVNAPIPPAEYVNPLFHGCINRAP